MRLRHLSSGGQQRAEPMSEILSHAITSSQPVLPDPGEALLEAALDDVLEVDNAQSGGVFHSRRKRFAKGESSLRIPPGART